MVHTLFGVAETVWYVSGVPAVLAVFVDEFGVSVIGDLVFVNLNVAGFTMLVVNSFEIAEELAGRRTKIYSARPYTTMVCDL
jgi:hypothetical protein